MQPFSGRPSLWEGQCLHKAAPRQRGGPHAWNCAIYFASFVGGAVPPQGRPQAAGGPASFSQVSTRFFQAGGCPTNQTSFFDSQKPAKPGKRGLIWKGSLGLAGS